LTEVDVRHKTWKVRRWERPPDVPDGEPIPLVCRRCETEADVPTAGHSGAMILAILPHGGIVFDPAGHRPPDYWMPEEIECRTCHQIMSAGRDDVREAV